MLLQGADFLWSDNQADCHSEYQQINKALCECKCMFHHEFQYYDNK